MSKGWESKSVDEQQAEAASRRASLEPTGAAGVKDPEHQRRVQDLELQREHILNERTANPHRRSALSEALATVERDLELLGWSIKL